MAKNDAGKPQPQPPRKSPKSPSGRSAPQEEEAAASSPVSSPDSATSSLVEDAGPAFDPEAREAAPVAPEPPPAAVPDLPEWDTETIANLLGIKGRMLHAAAGVGPQDWEYTELDLASIAPPLTRILNRYEPTRQYAELGDPLALGIAGAGYMTRSLLERRAAVAARAAEETERPIPPATEPPPTAPAPAPPPPPSPLRTTAAPPPPPAPAPEGAAINAGEVSWQRPDGG